MEHHEIDSVSGQQPDWLRNYYAARAAFSILWVVAALSTGQQSATIAAGLLILYPAWDAAANYLDGARNGGLARNRTQAINAVSSVAVTLAVLVALSSRMNWVLAVFGLWAILAGIMQLTVALRRRKSSGAQWPMILSGGQSALAGAAFLFQAATSNPPVLGTVAGYAAFGAFYFVVSAVWLSVAGARRTA